MKYTVAVMLLLGAISSAEAIQLQSSGFLQSDLLNNNPPVNQQALQVAQQKAKDAAQKAEASKKKVEALKTQQLNQNSKPTTQVLQKVDPNQKPAQVKKVDKPSSAAKIQTQSSMDVKTGTGLVVSVEAVKKPEGANKLQELAAMEEALKKATEEAHKQRVALTSGDESLAQGEAQTASSKALLELQ